MGFPRQEYLSGFPFPPAGDVLDPGIELVSPALSGRFFTTEPKGKPQWFNCRVLKITIGIIICEWRHI